MRSATKLHCCFLWILGRPVVALGIDDDSSSSQEPAEWNESCNHEHDDNAVSVVMVLKDCANGPFGQSTVMRHDLATVFGHSLMMCYSLDYGYVTYAIVRRLVRGRQWQWFCHRHGLVLVIVVVVVVVVNDNNVVDEWICTARTRGLVQCGTYSNSTAHVGKSHTVGSGSNVGNPRNLGTKHDATRIWDDDAVTTRNRSTASQYVGIHVSWFLGWRVSDTVIPIWLGRRGIRDNDR